MSSLSLVKLINNEPVISHLIIAENTNNQQKSIQDLIVRFKNDFEEFGQLQFEIATVKNSVGAVNEKKIFYLNEQQATLLMTYLKNSKVVRDFKKKLVKEFFKMREFIQNQTNHTNLNEKVINLNESKVREAFFIAFDRKCYYTDENLSKSHFHIDHILPKSKGGQDYLSNLVVCKPKVNQIKSDSYDESFVTHHQSIVSKKFAPKVKSILDLLEKNRQEFDPKYLFNGAVMNKLEDLYGRESIKELYSKIIPDLNYTKSKKIETKTTEYFIRNCVVKSDGERLPTIKLYEYYLDFCDNSKISPYGKIRFFKLFRYLKRVPNMTNLKMTFFDDKKQRYFENLEVIS